MSTRRASGQRTRYPDHDDVEAKLGSWPTIAGETPTATQLQRAASEITSETNDVTTTERLAMQSLRYVWRRQRYPHGRDWKATEDACQRVLEVVR